MVASVVNSTTTTRTSPAATVTAADGSFRFWGVKAVAGYSIAAAKDGYRTVEYDGLRLESGRKRLVRFRLKRPDERYVTMLAYDHPAFVEDIARDVAVKLQLDGRVAFFRVHVRSDESIHNHSAFAEVVWSRDQGPNPT